MSWFSCCKPHRPGSRPPFRQRFPMDCRTKPGLLSPMLAAALLTVVGFPALFAGTVDAYPFWPQTSGPMGDGLTPGEGRKTARVGPPCVQCFAPGGKVLLGGKAVFDGRSFHFG